MTEAKHTPGPWDGSHIGHDSLAQLHIYGPDGLHIYHQDRPEAVQEANARLCAAAPELLEALRAAHHALTVTHNLRATDLALEIIEAHLNNGIPRNSLEWIIDHTTDLAKVEAAIAKATGADQ